jgi:hypothetical protein
MFCSTLSTPFTLSLSTDWYWLVFSFQGNVWWTSPRIQSSFHLTSLAPCMMPTNSASLHLERSPSTAQMQPARAPRCGALALLVGCLCAKPNTSLGQTAPAVEKGNGVTMASVWTRRTRSILMWVFLPKHTHTPLKFRIKQNKKMLKVFLPS